MQRKLWMYLHTFLLSSDNRIYTGYIKKKFSDKDHDDDDFIDFSIEEKKMSVVARKYVVHR